MKTDSDTLCIDLFRSSLTLKSDPCLTKRPTPPQYVFVGVCIKSYPSSDMFADGSRSARIFVSEIPITSHGCSNKSRSIFKSSICSDKDAIFR